jgi:AcrR family transcriptional regulator
LLGNCPGRKRRKEARPAEIVEAARLCFIDKGFGTVYLYFDSKEALFEAVVRANVSPVVDSVIAAIEADPNTPAPDQLIFCARTMYREMVTTDKRKLMQLVIAEGVRFPWLAEFYYREVVGKGKELIRAVIRRGEQRGELKANGIDRYPEILMAPTVVAGIFSLVFAEHVPKVGTSPDSAQTFLGGGYDGQVHRFEFQVRGCVSGRRIGAAGGAWVGKRFRRSVPGACACGA